MRNRIFLFIVIFFLFQGLAQSQVAQGVTRSTIIEQYKGKPYYIHFVKADETITLISKAYGVTPERIFQENEDAKEGIFKDMILKIPVMDVTLNPAQNTKPTTTKERIVTAPKSAVNETRNNLQNTKNDSAIVTKANTNGVKNIREKTDKLSSERQATTALTNKDRLSPGRQESPSKTIPVPRDSAKKQQVTVLVKNRKPNDKAQPVNEIKTKETNLIKDRSLSQKSPGPTSQNDKAITSKTAFEGISRAENNKESIKNGEASGDKTKQLVNDALNKAEPKANVSRSIGVPTRRIVGVTSDSLTNSEKVKNSVNHPDRPKKGRPGFIDYMVKSKETLYGISKRYNVTIDEILAANEGMGALKAGVTIKIPTIIYIQEDTAVVVRNQSTNNLNNTSNASAKKTVDTRKVEYEYKIFRDLKSMNALVKATGLTKEQLIALNPSLKDGILAVQVIKLPIKPDNNSSIIVKADPINKPDLKDQKNKTDSVESGNSRKANEMPKVAQIPKTAIRQIKVKESDDKSSIPEILSVPGKKLPDLSSDTCMLINDPSREYNVALLLPFFLQDIDSTLMNDPENAKEAETYPQFDFMQFYGGALIALDSLDQAGFKFRLHVFDVDHGTDSIKALRILARPEFARMDLIIGPIYANSYNIVARYARRHEINIINLLAKRNNILSKNPFAFKVQPGDQSSALILADYIAKEYPQANLLVVRHDLLEQLNLVREFTNQAKKSGLVFKEIIYKTEGYAAISKNLKPGKQNIILLLSANKVTVPDLTTKLNKATSTYDITLFGIPGWENIQLEPEFLSNLKLHLISNSYIDYEDNSVKRFITLFREKYNTEPEVSKYAYLGFDITWYFLNALKSYGKDYSRCLPNLRLKGLQSSFDFRCKMPGDGYENQKVSVIKLDGYHWVESQH